MIRSLRNAALAFVALLAVFFAVPGAPAQASEVYNCPEGDVCLFDGTNYGTYSTWTNTLTAINWSSSGGASGCVNLVNIPGEIAWGYMNNAASSLIVNPYPQQTSFVVGFHMNLNCTGTPTLRVHTGLGLYLDPDLRNGAPAAGPYGGVSSNISNAITSISVRFP